MNEWMNWQTLRELQMYRIVGLLIDTFTMVGQIKWQHFAFLLVTNECIYQIVWFLAHIYKATNGKMTILC